jgi:site-specific DNA-methyltransferase (adenine-specific)
VGNFNLDTDEQKEWYSIGTNRSSEHLGDCLELMQLIADESIDMILCDLPYGTTACKWDTIIPFDKLWKQYERIIKPNGAIILTATQPFTTALISSNYNLFKYELIWNKVLPTGFAIAKHQPMKQHENILVFGNGKITYNPQKTKRDKPRVYNRTHKSYSGSENLQKHDGENRTLEFYEPRSIIDFSNANHKNKQHPTEKPIDLFKWLINTYSNENEIILDNTAGVFTTAIACLETNRKYIVMEKEKEYYNKGLKRILEWEREQKTKLF